MKNLENPCRISIYGGGATLSSNRKGFTLAETMIVVVILGLIAALTVPNLINKQKETTQRTKVKKAMAAYETAVNKMIIENDRSFNNLNEEGCNKTVNHFKYIKRDSNNGCIFQAPDKLWWDLTYIERPVISFNEITAQNRGTILQNANNPSDMSAFVMVGRFDDQGILRVDDLAYEQKNPEVDENSYLSNNQVEKLYNFINKTSTSETSGFRVSQINFNCSDWGEYEGEACYVCESMTVELSNGSNQSFPYNGDVGESSTSHIDLYPNNSPACSPTLEEAKKIALNDDSYISTGIISTPNADGSIDGNFCEITQKNVSCELYSKEGITGSNGLTYNCYNLSSDYTSCEWYGNGTEDVSGLGTINMDCSDGYECHFEKELDNGIYLSGGYVPVTPYDSYTYVYAYGVGNEGSDEEFYISCEGSMSCTYEHAASGDVHYDCDIIKKECEDGFKF